MVRGASPSPARHRMAPLSLTDRHRAVLSSRRISDEVAQARGYLSAETGKAVERLGFPASSRPVKAISRAQGDFVLAIPLYAPGETTPTCYQARPDVPFGTGKNVPKYEVPAKAEVPSDCNPLTTQRGWTFDLDVPVILTEGLLKADSILSAAIEHDTPVCPIGLIGVTAGRTRNKMLAERFIAPDVQQVCVPGRTTMIAFDSDYRTNPNVLRELFSLASHLAERGCSVVFIDIPTTDDGNKQGADDWLAANNGDFDAFLALGKPFDPDDLAETLAAVSPSLLPGSGSSAAKLQRTEMLRVDYGHHRVIEVRFRHNAATGMSEKVEQVVAEFSGRIVQQITEYNVAEDGQLERGDARGIIEFAWIEDGTGDQRTDTLTLPLAELGSLTKWRSKSPELARRWVSGSRSTQEQIGIAICSTNDQDWKMDPPLEILSSSGWSRLPGAGWRYTHATGSKRAIGDDTYTIVNPATDVRRLTLMPSKLAPIDDESSFRVADEERQAAHEWIRQVVRGKAVRGNDQLVNAHKLLAMGAVWAFRSVLPIRPLTTPVYFVGSPQCGKSVMAKNWSSYFGEGYVKQMFGSMKDTAVGLELKIAAARHMGAVIDDVNFASRRDVDGQTQAIDRMVRAAHDQADRTRGRADLTVRAAPPMMASLLFTGETMPDTSGTDSLISRLLVIRFPERLDAKALDLLNGKNEFTDRRNELHRLNRTALASFVRWLAHKMDSWNVSHNGEITRYVLDEFGAHATALKEHILETRPELTAFQESNARTFAGLENLALGAAAMAAWARDMGCSKADIDDIEAAAVKTMTMALLVTIDTINAHNPSNSIAGLIPEVLRSGTGHIAYVTGQPPHPSVANQWGWFADSEGRLSPRGVRFGRVLTNLKGSSAMSDAAILIDPSALSKALRDLGYKFVESQMKRQLGEAKIDGETVLARPLNPGELTSHYTVGGKQIRAIGIKPHLFDITIPQTRDGSAEDPTETTEEPVPALKVLRADLEL